MPNWWGGCEFPQKHRSGWVDWLPMNLNQDVLITIMHQLPLDDFLTFSMASKFFRELSKSRRLKTLTFRTTSSADFFISNFTEDDSRFVCSLNWYFEGKMYAENSRLFKLVFSLISSNISAVTVGISMINFLLLEIASSGSTLSEVKVFSDSGIWYQFPQTVFDSKFHFELLNFDTLETDIFELTRSLITLSNPKILHVNALNALTMADLNLYEQLIEFKKLVVQFRNLRDLRLFDDRWSFMWNYVDMKTFQFTLLPLVKIKVKTKTGYVDCTELPVSRRFEGFDLDLFSKILKFFDSEIHFILKLETLAVKNQNIAEKLTDARKLIENPGSRISVLEIRNTDIYGGKDLIDGLSDIVSLGIAQLKFRAYEKNLGFQQSDIEKVESSVLCLIPRLQNIVSLVYEMDSDSELAASKLAMLLKSINQQNNPHFSHLKIGITGSKKTIPISKFGSLLPSSVKTLHLTAPTWDFKKLNEVLEVVMTNVNLKELNIHEEKKVDVEQNLTIILKGKLKINIVSQYTFWLKNI
ncbi:hypothetical protein HK096_003363 [Nowakowskiella sp. JEL0078]|nr:hypothetical protein HK096_003363 [Nowakowskiella sp. JEL0078]